MQKNNGSWAIYYQKYKYIFKSECFVLLVNVCSALLLCVHDKSSWLYFVGMWIVNWKYFSCVHLHMLFYYAVGIVQWSQTSHFSVHWCVDIPHGGSSGCGLSGMSLGFISVLEKGCWIWCSASSLSYQTRTPLEPELRCSLAVPGYGLDRFCVILYHLHVFHFCLKIVMCTV